MMRLDANQSMADHYLDRLSQDAVFNDAAFSSVESVAQVHRLLAEHESSGASTAQDSVEERLRLAYLDPLANINEVNTQGEGASQREAFHPPFAPPIARTSMVPVPWGELNPIKRWRYQFSRAKKNWVGRTSADIDRLAWPADPNVQNVQSSQLQGVNSDLVDSPDPYGNWQGQGNVRRVILLTLMLAQTGFATYYMSKVLPYQGTAKLEIVLLALFAILFCWVSAGFWTAMAGFLVLLRRNDRFAITRDAGTASISPAARTAVVMPICNEDVARVMAGLRATYESVGRSDELARFDFFILSDSNQADVRTAELAAWADLCKSIGGFGRIFYRHRKRRVKRKSGNIDDFCRRWGKNYRYMIVLDADSVMSGDCLVNLVRLMEKNPASGIIQTSPVASGRDSLYARIQQFSTRVYGPLFTAGLHYWQLGESHYWGHNAIIRMAPFMRHCALSALPGKGSLAGEILSHDFVEAALMRRAGWGVWIAYDLDGSYEEMPSTLLEELKRDRRWCHGNLMNFRLFTARGMHRVHRAVFATGVMAYLSAPLWLLFLSVSTGLLAFQTLVDPQYFQHPRQLFPIWPQWHPEKALALFSATATLLFLPKILSVLLICLRGAKLYGGPLKLTVGMFLEMLFSMLLAPVRMMFHTRFVLAAFLGWALHWKSPPRGDAQTGWREALAKHGGDMLLGAVWAIVVFSLNPFFLPWLLPIAGGLMLSAPISVLSSRVSIGRRMRTARIFIIPEEVETPVEMRVTARYYEAAQILPDFSDAVVDPALNALASAAARKTRLVEGVRKVVNPALADDLNEKEKNAILDDAYILSALHDAVWSSHAAHDQWLSSRST